MKTVLIAFVALLVSATAVQSQLAPQNARRAARIRSLIEWVNKAGRDNGLQKEVAEQFGFGGPDLPARLPAKRKAYEHDETKERYFFHVLEVKGVTRYVLAYKDPRPGGGSDIWNVAPSGAILDYLTYHRNRLEHPKDPNLGLFDKVVSFLEGEMHEAGF